MTVSIYTGDCYEEYQTLVYNRFYLYGGLVGTLFVPVLFYTYSGILGQNIAWVDIAIFFVSVFLTFVCAWILRRSERIYQKGPPSIS